jgi:exopolysaccharide production protein ExoY
MLRIGGEQPFPINPVSAGMPESPMTIFADVPAPPPPATLGTVGGVSKRLMDVALAALALILAAPVMAATALLVRITMGGPVVFAHRRVGRGGETFDCYKFRTMVRDADEVLASHLAADPAAAEEWRTTRKLRNDPRVTPVGRALRKSSLDELPQLFNVLRGEMSCVGPRPIVSDELTRYGADAVAYLSVRPGVTGAWQVGGRSSLSYDARVALDRAYVHDWSLWRDVVIILRTVPALLSHDDAA